MSCLIKALCYWFYIITVEISIHFFRTEDFLFCYSRCFDVGSVVNELI